MYKTLLPILFSFLFFDALKSQNIQTMTFDSLPYFEIPSYPTAFSQGALISRMLDGLGYRYYWATKGLNTENLTYRPSEDASSTFETIEHLYGLAKTINDVAHGKASIRPYPELSSDYDTLRVQTLYFIKEASDIFRSTQDLDLSQHEVIFQRGEKKSKFPFWNLINGQIADAIYHTGQIVSFRRTSGNPLDSKVNVFLGKNRE